MPIIIGKYEEALRDLVDAIMDGCPDAAREIDAGCDGEGALATAMVAIGRHKTLKKATKEIYGDYEE